MRAIPRSFVVSFVVSIALASYASAQQVTVTDLPLIGDAVSNSAFAINNTGDAVGVSVHASAPINRAAVWRNHVGIELDLGCPACNSVANDINDAGDIVGGFLSGIGFLWRNGVTTVLPPLPGDTSSLARGINNLGIVVGQSSGPTGSRPVRWINGVPEDLGVLGSNGPSTFGIAEAISDSGVIVGQTSNTGTGNLAFTWVAGVMTSLGTLPVGTCPKISSASGINEQGVVVGQSEEGTAIPNCFLKPVRWVNGVAEALPSGAFGSALDINEDGDIVGTSGPAGQQVATLWRNGESTSLGGLNGFAQSIASEISDAGVIVARSLFPPVPTGIFRAYTVEVTPANTLPSINVPSDLIVNATAPNGAAVTFIASGDDAEDGTLVATCNPPSGATFGIGTTTVSCEATDSGGLGASGSFTVTVLGASAQLDALIQQLGTDGAGSSLQNKLAGILADVNGSTPAKACGKLGAFINEVSAQSGKKLTAAQSALLIEAAQRIRAVIGC